MQDGPRVLVAAALGKIIEPFLRQSMSDASIRIAEDQAAVERAVSDRLRFDVVVADLTWNDYAIEYEFDGLDVLDILRSARRHTPRVTGLSVITSTRRSSSRRWSVSTGRRRAPSHWWKR